MLKPDSSSHFESPFYTSLGFALSLTLFTISSSQVPFDGSTSTDSPQFESSLYTVSNPLESKQPPHSPDAKWPTGARSLSQGP